VIALTKGFVDDAWQVLHILVVTGNVAHTLKVWKLGGKRSLQMKP
jgi:hypothetical protein